MGIFAFAGCPNVGKSTIFNRVTGLNQHTGNWSGKTVGIAFGKAKVEGVEHEFVDIPGAYSLAASSKEEELARDYICFGKMENIAVICDASSLARGISFAYQVMEAHDKVIVCVNLMDEAKKKGFVPNLKLLSEEMGVTVVGTNAAKGEGVDLLLEELTMVDIKKANPITYDNDIENAILHIIETLGDKIPDKSRRFIAISLLRADVSACNSIVENLSISLETLVEVSEKGRSILENTDNLEDRIAMSLGQRGAELAKLCGEKAVRNNLGIDKILTHKILGIPTMMALLALVFWLTITGANYPSQMLSNFLFGLGDSLKEACSFMPNWILGALFDGIWVTSAWVISVMLPPMAIFFPLFTLLEDIGYLPRIAFNLDGFFQKSHACGKQGLTMCMGFGCTAAGVVGCRIIDSERERMIAILTNSFVPCNGKFPSLIAIISVFFAQNALHGSLLLSSLIILGIVLTFIYSRILSATVLKGTASSFTLELPPYRSADPMKILVRSLIDRTAFVLGRAVVVAIPAGLFIWILGQFDLLTPISNFLDPVGLILGLNGVILLAFVLGLPANEIVIPVILMILTSQATLTEFASLSELGEILRANNWTEKTAICFLIFALLHWPCSTALLTIKKETGSTKWAVLSALLPLSAGVILCTLVNLIM